MELGRAGTSHFMRRPLPCCLTMDPRGGPRCKPAEIDPTTQSTDPTPTKDNTEGIRNSDNERSAPPLEGKLTCRVLTLVHLNPFRRRLKTPLTISQPAQQESGRRIPSGRGAGSYSSIAFYSTQPRAPRWKAECTPRLRSI